MPFAANVEAAIAKETGSASSSESSSLSPASGEGSGAESASAEQKPNEENAEANNVQKSKHEILAERLAEVRERRAANRLAQKAKTETDAAKTDREAAAAERAKWEGLKNGTFLEGMKALGKDPRVAFEEMKTEAIEAGKPETQIKRMQERFDGLLEEKLKAAVDPLKKEVEELREREKNSQNQAENARFVADFEKQIQSTDYLALRIEYGDERVSQMIRSFMTNPKALLAHAKALEVKLTHDDGRFSMREALTVLKKAQDRHEAQKQSRAQASSAPSQTAQAQAGSKPTVNGTTERAGNPLGNQTASSRASSDASQKPRLSRKERIEKLINSGS